MQIYVIHDRKIGAYMTPYFLENDVAARRSLGMAMKEDSIIFQYAEDYEVVELGSYDPIKGTIKPLDVPRHVCEASAIAGLWFVRKEAQERLREHVAQNKVSPAPQKAGETIQDVERGAK